MEKPHSIQTEDRQMQLDSARLRVQGKSTDNGLLSGRTCARRPRTRRWKDQLTNIYTHLGIVKSLGPVIHEVGFGAPVCNLLQSKYYHHPGSRTPMASIMRGRMLAASGMLFVFFIIFLLTPKSKIREHIPGSYPHVKPGNYPYVKPATPQIWTPVPNKPVGTPPPNKVIVKVQLEGEDLNWLLKLLPEWRNQVITIDKAFAHLHDSAQRVDKGRIADAYLTWIITNYNNLAETIVFVPPGLQKQEVDKANWRLPHKELVNSIETLQIPHVQKFGYAPLHCPKKEECEDTILPFQSLSDKYRTLDVKMAEMWEQMFNNTHVPEQLASPSGSEFAVSRDQIRRRSVKEWTRYWNWLAKTEMDDDSAGAVVERLWHVIFGKEGVWCPKAKECNCEVFGRC